MNSKAIAVAFGITTVLSLNAGAVAGYLYAKSKLGDEFDARLEREVSAAKRFYSKLHKKGENDMPTIVETPQSLPIERDAIQALDRYRGHGSDTAMDPLDNEEPPAYQTVSDHTRENNIFTSTSDISNEDYENLIRNRTEEAPYIITLAEFMNNEYGHQQDDLVYFQGDGILVDEKDEIVADPDALVGDDNLVKFGHYSGNERVVYVRNDALGLDLHITAHEGKYAYVVLGLENTDAVDVEV